MSKSCDYTDQTPDAINYIEPTYSGKRYVYRKNTTEVTGYYLYGQDDRDDGFFIPVPKAVCNLIPNPSFGVSLGGWNFEDVKGTRTNNHSFSDGFSLKLRGNGDTTDPVNLRSYAEIEVTDFTISTFYTVSAYAWLPEIYDNGQDDYYARLSVVFLDDTGTEIDEYFTDPITSIYLWKRLYLSFQVPINTDRLFVRLNLRGDVKRELTSPYNQIIDNFGNPVFNDASEYMYWDAIQFENGDISTFFNGDSAKWGVGDCRLGSCRPYTWNGEPHLSTSCRSECARDGGVLTSLTDLGFKIISHSGHDGIVFDNQYHEYSHRPGSFYQKSTIGPYRTLTFTSYNCSVSLQKLECEHFNLSKLLKPKLMGGDPDCSKVLIVYKHSESECEGDYCSNDKYLAIEAIYKGGFEYTRTNRHYQTIVLQFEVFDPLFWKQWPGSSSINLSFAHGVFSNRIVTIKHEGGYYSYPVDSGTDIRAIGCMSNGRVLVGGNYCQVNSDATSPNLSLYDCEGFTDAGFTLSCIQYDGTEYIFNNNNSDYEELLECETFNVTPLCANDVINVIKSFSSGTYIGGDFQGFIAYFDEKRNGLRNFNAYPGSEVFSLDKPFWAQIAVGTNDAVYILRDSGDWLSFDTNGRVYDLQTDNYGNIYAVGAFTTVDGIETSHIAKFNVNLADCLDIDSGEWESLCYSFDDIITEVELQTGTNNLFFGGNAETATPCEVPICKDKILRSLESSGQNQAIEFTNNTPLRVDLLITLENQLVRNMIEDCINEGNWVRFTSTSSSGMTYNFLINGNDALILGIDDGVDEVVCEEELLRTSTSSGQDQIFEFTNITATTVDLEITMKNQLARNMIGECSNWLRITATSSLTGIEYKFLIDTALMVVNGTTDVAPDFSIQLTLPKNSSLIGTCIDPDDPFLEEISQSNQDLEDIPPLYLGAGIGLDNEINSIKIECVDITPTVTESNDFSINIRLSKTSSLDNECDGINDTIIQELNLSNDDLGELPDIYLTDGIGIDNTLRRITIQCVEIDIAYQGDDITINHIARYDGYNLFALNDGLSGNVLAMSRDPITQEMWVGYEGGMAIWLGNSWVDYPGNISGNVIDFSICSQSRDIIILTDRDGGHVFPGITDLNYCGDVENFNAQIILDGRGTLEYLEDTCHKKKARFCAGIECGERTVFNIGDSSFLESSHDLSSSVLPNSRLDFWLDTCPQTFSMFIDNDNASTKATLVYQNHFLGLNAICCACKGNSPVGGGREGVEDLIEVCCRKYEFMHRPPTNTDCAETDWKSGDTWIDLSSSCGIRFFIGTHSENDANTCDSDCYRDGEIVLPYCCRTIVTVDDVPTDEDVEDSGTTWVVPDCYNGYKIFISTREDEDTINCPNSAC